MKKVLILLAVIPLLFGCEEFFYYDEISEPNLTAGKWILSSYNVVVISSISDVEVIYNDTICINAFGEQSYVDGGIQMKQIYEYTSPDRRFVVGETIWDFDDNSLSLYVNNDYRIRYPVDYPNYMMKEYDKITIGSNEYGGRTTYSFDSNGQGAMPPTELVLLSPKIVTDLYLSDGMRDKAVTVQVLLKFIQN